MINESDGQKAARYFRELAGAHLVKELLDFRGAQSAKDPETGGELVIIPRQIRLDKDVVDEPEAGDRVSLELRSDSREWLQKVRKGLISLDFIKPEDSKGVYLLGMGATPGQTQFATHQGLFGSHHEAVLIVTTSILDLDKIKTKVYDEREAKDDREITAIVDAAVKAGRLEKLIEKALDTPDGVTDLLHVLKRARPELFAEVIAGGNDIMREDPNKGLAFIHEMEGRRGENDRARNWTLEVRSPNKPSLPAGPGGDGPG